MRSACTISGSFISMKVIGLSFISRMLSQITFIYIQNRLPNHFHLYPEPLAQSLSFISRTESLFHLYPEPIGQSLSFISMNRDWASHFHLYPEPLAQSLSFKYPEPLGEALSFIPMKVTIGKLSFISRTVIVKRFWIFNESDCARTESDWANTYGFK